jgi:hypothetical protein
MDWDVNEKAGRIVGNFKILQIFPSDNFGHFLALYANR